MSYRSKLQLISLWRMPEICYKWTNIAELGCLEGLESGISITQMSQLQQTWETKEGRILPA